MFYTVNTILHYHRYIISYLIIYEFLIGKIKDYIYIEYSGFRETVEVIKNSRYFFMILIQ